jgi:FkbM family methyltransferase
MSILFDIGANKGLFTDSNRSKFDKCVLVEPIPSLCDFLRNKYNQDTNISIEQSIVSSTKDLPFYICEHDVLSTCDPDWISKSRHSAGHYRYTKLEETNYISIDELIEKYGSPSFIKIDVEGYELNVLKSMSKKTCDIAFEWAEEKKVETLETVVYLNTLGYDKFHIQMDDKYDYIPNNWFSFEEFNIKFSEMCDENRKTLWGMIHCC